jgi:23S rRNA (cytidine2498-2'-O)-methyltransferase
LIARLETKPISIGTAYLAADGFTRQLIDELKDVTDVYDRLIVTSSEVQEAYWCQNIWFDVARIPIGSIGDGAKKLKAIQKHWSLYPYQAHRRAALIADQLPKFKVPPLEFGAALPAYDLGSWTLIDDHTMLVAGKCLSKFANGELNFVENKIDPPNRAYLKLWEALTVIDKQPKAGETCIDLGASPGGWTWVLAQLGADVIAIDRSPLDPRIEGLPNVKTQKGNAFSVKPEDYDKPIDWLFSDVICYPDKLYEYLQPWIQSGKCKNFVVTLKFQGHEHYHMAAKFAQIPGSTVRHLFQNKHELTWTLLGK